MTEKTRGNHNRRTARKAPRPEPAGPVAPIDPAGFFDERGWLTPKPVDRPLFAADQVTPAHEKLWAHLAVADELQSASRADRTLQTYGYHCRKFIAWCEDHSLNPLPATAETVMAHLTDIAVVTDEYGNPLRDDEGRLLQETSLSNVSLRLAAINKLHDFAGVPQPGDSEQVRAIVASVSRVFGSRAANPKAALDLDALVKVVEAVRCKEYRAVRDAAIVWARSAGLTGGQLAALTWDDVVVDADVVELTPPKSKARGGAASVEIVGPRGRMRSAHGRGPLEVFQRLAELTPADRRIVFAHPDGRALDRHAFVALVDKAGAEDGGWASWSEAGAQRVAEAAGGVWLTGTAVVRRNVAMLVVGWFLAHRRSNLVGLNWRDVTFEPGGVRILTRFSKTDQTGVGSVQFLPRVGEDVDSPDPVAVLEEWRDALRHVAGVDEVDPSWPLFPIMSANGRVKLFRGGRPKRLASEAVNDLVTEAAAAAGLPGSDDPKTYGAHSLRSGFVTEGLRDDKLSIQQVQEVTGHKSVATLLQYRREANIEKSSPAAALLRARRKRDG